MRAHWSWGVAAILMSLAACGPKHVGTLQRNLGRTPTGKAVAIYSDPKFVTSEQVAIDEPILVRAMRSSSYFVDDDIAAVAALVAEALTEIEPDQRVAVVSQGADQPVYHFFARGGEIHIVRYRGGKENTRHSSAIPAAAVSIKKKPPPLRPSEPIVVGPKVEPVPAETTTPGPNKVPEKTVPKTSPTDGKGKKKKPHRGAKKPHKGTKKPGKGPRLSEKEIRAKIKELDRLHAKGLITADEYKAKKKKLLDQL